MQIPCKYLCQAHNLQSDYVDIHFPNFARNVDLFNLQHEEDRFLTGIVQARTDNFLFETVHIVRSCDIGMAWDRSWCFPWILVKECRYYGSHLELFIVDLPRIVPG